MFISNLLQKISQLVVAGSIALCFAAPACATQYFGFDYAGTYVSGYGFLTGIDNGDGTFTATEGSGYQTIAGLTESFTLVFNSGGSAVSVSPAGAFTFDNQLNHRGSPLLSDSGLLFMTQSQEINLSSIIEDGVLVYRYYEQNLYSEIVSFRAVEALPGGPIILPPQLPVGVPEPSSWMLLLLGLVCFSVRRTWYAKVCPAPRNTA